MDMTPSEKLFEKKKTKKFCFWKIVFRISSNFTVSVLSSTDLEIEFPNENLVCNGNLTRVDRNNNSHEV
jgi:hypothetical protein